MKKLIVLLAFVAAAFGARADLYLYWTVADWVTSSSYFKSAEYAQIFGATEGGEYVSLGATVIGSAAKTTIDGPSASPYINYIVHLLDESEKVVGVSPVSTYSDFLAAVAVGDRGNMSTPPMSPYTFNAFMIPEPTSGLMLLLGLGALALKRKDA